MISFKLSLSWNKTVKIPSPAQPSPNSVLYASLVFQIPRLLPRIGDFQPLHGRFILVADILLFIPPSSLLLILRSTTRLHTPGVQPPIRLPGPASPIRHGRRRIRMRRGRLRRRRRGRVLDQLSTSTNPSKRRDKTHPQVRSRAPGKDPLRIQDGGFPPRPCCNTTPSSATPTTTTTTGRTASGRAKTQRQPRRATEPRSGRGALDVVIEALDDIPGGRFFEIGLFEAVDLVF